MRFTPEVASRPDRIEKDLAQVRRLAAVLEDEYERVRTFRPEPPVVQSEGTEGSEQPEPEDVLTRDASAEDEPPPEKGSDAVERRIERLIAELPSPENEEEEKALEVKKVSLAGLFVLSVYSNHDIFGRIRLLWIFTWRTFVQHSIHVIIASVFAITLRSCSANALNMSGSRILKHQLQRESSVQLLGTGQRMLTKIQLWEVKLKMRIKTIRIRVVQNKESRKVASLKIRSGAASGHHTLFRRYLTQHVVKMRDGLNG